MAGAGQMLRRGPTSQRHEQGWRMMQRVATALFSPAFSPYIDAAGASRLWR